MTAHAGPPDKRAGAHWGAGAGRVEAAGGSNDTSSFAYPTHRTAEPTERRIITAAAITRLLSSRCVDCNGPTVGDTQSILDGFCLFLTRQAATCPMWSKRARRHGISNDDVLVHPLGHLAGDQEVFVFLADVGDEGMPWLTG